MNMHASIMMINCTDYNIPFATETGAFVCRSNLEFPTEFIHQRGKIELSSTLLKSPSQMRLLSSMK